MNVVILGSSGYPKSFSANNTKNELMAMGLQEAGCKVAMLDTIFGTKGQTRKEIGVSTSGISYCLLPRSNKYLALFFNIHHIWNYLKSRKEKGDINHVILSTGYFPVYLLLVFLSKCAGYSRSIHITEWDLGMVLKKQIDRLNAYAIDKWFGYFVNLILPISHFLQSKSEHFQKPIYLLPVLASYERSINYFTEKNHFTYCGHAGYLLRNRQLLKAFKQIRRQYDHVRLTLVLVGNQDLFNTINILLKQEDLHEAIDIKSQVSQKTLYEIYDSSIGLLIPLDPQSMQDEARFSQKIAEYVASKRPIITSSVGEIPYYFKDNENAVVVPFTEEGYAEGMERLISNPALADNIGLKGFEVGCQYFNYKNVGLELKNFIMNAVQR